MSENSVNEIKKPLFNEAGTPLCYGINVTKDEIRMDISHSWSKMHTDTESLFSLSVYRIERILYRKNGEIWLLLRHMAAEKNSAIIRFSIGEKTPFSGTGISGSIAHLSHENAKAVFYQIEEEENQ